MASFDEYLDALKEPLAKLVQQNFSDFANAVKNDIKDFLEHCKQDLIRWIELLAAKKITTNEYNSLLIGAESLGRLHALKQAGLAQARRDLFISGLVVVLVNTAITVLL
ncbi:hypothetical protein [Pseudomonas sp. GL-RE-20]|uniref:hypothetical protein n=1 Tax=Pseudomonas sp. GL-RE-20 TaxID=2832372 RepID=UPI001CBB7920|nr:hypothetical protein [Pseudomonas sp. GL-RE-20]